MSSERLPIPGYLTPEEVRDYLAWKHVFLMEAFRELLIACGKEDPADRAPYVEFARTQFEAWRADNRRDIWDGVTDLHPGVVNDIMDDALFEKLLSKAEYVLLDGAYE